MSRVIVCGSRSWDDTDAMLKRLDQLPRSTVLVHGDAEKGADHWTRKIASVCGFPEDRHRADWKRRGKRAGLERNEEMAASGADLCIAFWDGSSRGTAHMIKTAHDHGIPVEVIRSRPPGIMALFE